MKKYSFTFPSPYGVTVIKSVFFCGIFKAYGGVSVPLRGNGN